MDPVRRVACIVSTVAPALLAAVATPGHAAEGYKLRQSPVGVFGGEIAAPVENPGFFGTAVLSHTRIGRVVDDQGNDIAVPARTVPLPTGTPTGGAVPNGTYSLLVPAGSIGFEQTQTQLNLLGGYVSEGLYAGGRLAFVVNLPLIRQSRDFEPSQPLGTVSPTPAATLPLALRGAIAAVASAANAQVQAGLAAGAANQNVEVSGVGDTELSMGWTHQQDRLKVVAGVSLFLPTGKYDKTRGPNPGFGDFYTLRPGVTVIYAPAGGSGGSGWDSGLTLAGRMAYGMNTRNQETDTRSGDFVYVELGAVKVTGNWAFGANLLALQQVSSDSGPATLARYRNFSAGPFVSYKLPGREAGFNLHYSQNFGSRNALMAQTLQLRFIKAW